MLRVIESTAVAHAKTYFSTADYYTEGQELRGEWRGKGAERLKLEGPVDQKSWEALCDNRHPETGTTLTQRQKAERRVGYDFNFHVPKSCSVLWALTQDERLLGAFRESVRETMQDIETEMKTRVRRGGKNDDRVTGNLIWGEFVHFTSRPVDGMPDPHLHAHCFAFNTTYDEEEARWKAGQFGDIKRDAPYFEGKFHIRLGRKLAELGLAVDRTAAGWEVAGATPELVETFSRRTREIEELARKKGITDPEQKAALGARTRKKKDKELPLDQLREVWRSWLSPEDQSWLARCRSQIGGSRLPEQPDIAQAAVRLAADHCFERSSVVPERKLLAASFKRAVGGASLGNVERAFEQHGFLIRERKGRRMATTSTVLGEEQEMLQFARDGRGTCQTLGRGPHEFARTWLNAGQRSAVEHVLQSRDRVMIVRGAAGVGKTSMMQEAAEAITAGGKEVFTFAPSARASRGVLRGQGFEEADTVARLLLDQVLQRRIRGQVVWIDEAGLVGSRTMAQLFDLAERLDARVILSGDRYQHGSVERGAALRLLEQEAGIVPAEIKEIQRQKGDYKRAVQALSQERVEEGFRRLDELGWIREVPDRERYRALASDYVETVCRNETALVVSPTHREAQRITAEIRRGLRQQGRLATGERALATLKKADLTEAQRADRVHYAPRDVLLFHQNARGFKKGERLTVGAEPVPVDQAARFEVYRPASLDVAAGEVLRVTKNAQTLSGKRVNNGDLVHLEGFDRRGNLITDAGVLPYGFPFLDYGYVATSHASQGSDVKRVFIGQSAESFPASSREQFYVSVSRGQAQATIYTDSKEDLWAAVRRSEERLSATELVSDARVNERVTQRQQLERLSEIDRRHWEHAQLKEPLAYER